MKTKRDWITSEKEVNMTDFINGSTIDGRLVTNLHVRWTQSALGEDGGLHDPQIIGQYVFVGANGQPFVHPAPERWSHFGKRWKEYAYWGDPRDLTAETVEALAEADPVLRNWLETPASGSWTAGNLHLKHPFCFPLATTMVNGTRVDHLQLSDGKWYGRQWLGYEWEGKISSTEKTGRKHHKANEHSWHPNGQRFERLSSPDDLVMTDEMTALLHEQMPDYIPAENYNTRGGGCEMIPMTRQYQ